MRVLYCILVAVFLHSLSFSQKKNNYTGQWQLVSWSIGLEMDLNNDKDYSLNLIEETNCKNNETLTISSNGTLKSTNTFNPTVNISNRNSKYIFSEKCNKGSIGFSNAFTFESNDIQLDTGGKYKLTEEGNLLRVFEGAINVFNSDFSEILETRDLVLTYKKL